MVLQSILLPKKYFNMLTAKKWISKNGYKLEHRNKQPELIKNYYHFRQSDKNKTNKYIIKKKNNILYVIAL